MTKLFESEFHRRYVGGAGVIEDRQATLPIEPFRGQSYEQILQDYRRYVNDPQAELPEELMEQLKLLGKIK